MKIKHFYEPILGVNCYFIYEWQDKEELILKSLKRRKAILKDTTWESFNIIESNRGKTIEYMKDGIIRYIVFIKGRWYDTLVHEAIHMVNMAFAVRGIKGDYDNDEYYAYYVSYWYGLWEKVLNKK